MSVYWLLAPISICHSATSLEDKEVVVSVMSSVNVKVYPLVSLDCTVNVGAHCTDGPLISFNRKTTATASFDSGCNWRSLERRFTETSLHAVLCRQFDHTTSKTKF